jgi:hypothetical protein
MTKTNPRVDAYIKRAAPFARPILKRLRTIVHTGCPVSKKRLSGIPCFSSPKGIICFMAPFKRHCAFGFWKGALIFGAKNKGAMGHFARKAAELNEAGLRNRVRDRVGKKR